MDQKVSARPTFPAYFFTPAFRHALLTARRKRGRGRPRKPPMTILGAMLSKRKGPVGRPRTFTPDAERWLRTRIDQRKAAYLKKHGDRLSDRQALWDDMFKYYESGWRREGIPLAEARKRAEKAANRRIKTLAVRLSLIRGKARKHEI